MELVSQPETRKVTRRFIDIVYPTKVVSYALMVDDLLERDGDVMRITFASGKQTEVFLTQALAIETETITREEPVGKASKSA